MKSTCLPEYIDTIIMDLFANVTILNAFHIFLVVLAGLCFLPQIVGYQFLMDSYPDGLAILSGRMFSYSLVASIAVTIPFLLENLVNVFTRLYFTTFGKSSDSEISYFRFPTDILLLVMITDLILLSYIIPYQIFDALPGLLCCRDILFTWSFLLNLHKLGGSVWTLPKVSFIMFFSVLLNWIYAWSPMLESEEIMFILLNIQYILISFMILALLLFTTQWFHHVYNSNYENLDLQTILRNMQTSVFAIFICIYIIYDFTPGLAATTLPTNWGPYGETYLTMLTYMMAGCVLCVNVITTSISKIGSLEISKVLSYCKNHYIYSYFLLIM